MTVHIAKLFPTLTNSQGDAENAAVAGALLTWLGHDVRVVDLGPDDASDFLANVIVFGHVVPSQINLAFDALGRLLPWLREQLAQGGLLVAVGGAGEVLVRAGLLGGVFDLRHERAVDDLLIRTPDGMDVWGFENSATTYKRAKSEAPLGEVIRGSGNGDHTEGALLRPRAGGTIIWTNLHGPVFARNPEFALTVLANVPSLKIPEHRSAQDPLLDKAISLARDLREARQAELSH